LSTDEALRVGLECSVQDLAALVEDPGGAAQVDILRRDHREPTVAVLGVAECVNDFETLLLRI